MTNFWDKDRRARLLDERNAIAAQAVAEGVGPLVAAQRMGLTSTYSMYRWAKRVGIQDTDLWVALRGPAVAPPMSEQDIADRIEDIEWLADSGVADVEVARRVGLTTTYLERWLCKHGRYDLWRRLSKYHAYATELQEAS